MAVLGFAVVGETVVSLDGCNFCHWFNYRSEINKALIQNPSPTAKTLLEIADTNYGLNFDENGDQPWKNINFCFPHNL